MTEPIISSPRDVVRVLHHRGIRKILELPLETLVAAREMYHINPAYWDAVWLWEQGADLFATHRAAGDITPEVIEMMVQNGILPGGEA